VPAIASKPASEPCRRTTRTNEEWGSSTPTRKRLARGTESSSVAAGRHARCASCDAWFSE
jgi:hypothetical protein